MDIRSLVVVVLCAIGYGCATPPEPPPVAAAAAPAKAEPNTVPVRYRARSSITGSRLPPMDDDELGASSTSAVSKGDYMHDDDARIKILNSK